jgi:hypothetical protein
MEPHPDELRHRRPEPGQIADRPGVQCRVIPVRDGHTAPVPHVPCELRDSAGRGMLRIWPPQPQGQGSTSPYSLWPSCLRRSTEACPGLGAIGVSVCAATPGLWYRQPDCSGSRLVGAVNMLIPRRRAIGQPVKKRPSSAQGRNHRYGSPAEHRSRPRRRGRRVVLEQRTRRRTPARFGTGRPRCSAASP